MNTGMVTDERMDRAPFRMVQHVPVRDLPESEPEPEPERPAENKFNGLYQCGGDEPDLVEQDYTEGLLPERGSFREARSYAKQGDIDELQDAECHNDEPNCIREDFFPDHPTPSKIFAIIIPAM
jgi:hypothetical protein